MQDNLELNYESILEYKQNRDQYLMIDHATKVVPGKSAVGYKNLTENEWFFKIHWPGDPNMPGALQFEAMVQMSSLAILTLPNNKGKVLYLVSANNLKFIKKVLPNTRLNLETEIKSFKRGLAHCTALGHINSKVVCKAEFNLILPDEIKKYKL